jgi:hypothetical protein
MIVKVGYSVTGRSRGRVALHAICTVYVETRSAGFFVEPQNQGRRFVSGSASKPLGKFSPVWPFTIWGIEIMAVLPRAPGGFRFLFITIDTFTKWMEAMPVVNSMQDAAVKFM